MFEFLRNLFDSDSFMPHGHCYLWRPDILWLNVGSDAVIAVAYYAIPVFLIYFVKKRKDLAFNWIFVMFALFIIACGTTHIMEIWTIWHPQYGSQGLVKLFTACVSIATAIALVPLMPKALALPSPKDHEESNRQQQRLNEELLQINASLESRVAERTRDISRLASIVEYSNDAIIGKDMQGLIISWNPAAQRLFGYTAPEIIGKSIYILVPESHHIEMSKIMHKVAEGETTQAFDTIHLTKDKRYFDVSLTISPVKDTEGKIIGSSSIIRDITSRKQAETKLTKSEARKAAILNASLEAIITIDHNGYVIEWNLTAEKTFGFSSTEAIGRELAELIIPQRFRKAHREGLALYMITSKGSVIGKRLEMPALRANGEEFPLELSIDVIPGSDGPPMFTASARDITVRVRAEEALKKNEERFRRVIEAAPNGLLMVDQAGKIALCNNGFENMFGYSREEIIGREMEFLLLEKDRHSHPSHRASFFHSPEARQMGAGRDLYGLRKDGAEVPVEISLNPLVTDEGTFVLASIVDITKRKSLEEHIRKSTDRIQQKNQEMEQFVYTVSHDLKSPLVTSSGFLGLLKEDIAAKRYDKVADSMTRLERANSRMSQLIDDLLQLSRVGQIRLDVENVDTVLLVKSICESLSAQIREKAVMVSVQDGMPSIMCDRKRIYQAFENLIINALKYGCEIPNPKITIGSEIVEGETRFFVRDNGPGIAKEYHKKIFGLFQRLENDNRGTGVGLTAVTRIMQLHFGRVWIESDVGSGATFWLAFPKNFVTQGETEYE